MRALLLCLMLSLCGQCYALDKYTDEMTSTTGWTDADSANGSWTQVTEDGRSCFRYYVGTAGSSQFSRSTRNMPVTGGVIVQRFATKTKTIGNVSAGNGFLLQKQRQGYTSRFALGLDGVFTYDGSSYVRVGTATIDLNVWIDWVVVHRAPTPGTATVEIWKDGVYIGSGDASNTAVLDAGITLINQSATTTNGAETFVDFISEESYGLYYHENMDSITDWTDSDEGNGVSSIATFQDVSAMDLYVPKSSGTSRALRKKSLEVNAFPKNYVIEARIYHDAIGTRASSNFMYIGGIPESGYSQSIYFASDGLFTYVQGTGYVERGTDLVSQDVWTTWRILVKQRPPSSSTMTIWKNGVLVVVDAPTTATAAIPTGTVYVGQYGYTLSGARTYIDYLRIYSEDGQLIQTVIE